MALEMRTARERCDAALTPDGEVRICSYECAFCVTCTAEMHGICPNCHGELLARPKRVAS